MLQRFVLCALIKIQGKSNSMISERESNGFKNTVHRVFLGLRTRDRVYDPKSINPTQKSFQNWNAWIN